MMGRIGCGAWVALALLAASAAADDAALRMLVEADWAAQEKRLGREAGSTVTAQAAVQRTDKLLQALSGRLHVERDMQQLATLRGELARWDQLDADRRVSLYRQIRWLGREVALKNPLVTAQPIVFLKRNRYVCQMLHEYLGYYYGEISGGGVFVLEQPGRSLAVRDVIGSRLPAGSFTTLALSYDANTLYFAHVERDKPKPDYYAPKKGQRFFHLYAVDIDGRNLRQLTHDACDDFDPCPLPDGGIAFMSTRRGGFGRCHNPWEPLPAYTLHRMDADGKNVRTLSFHETNEWHPSILHDGRVVYIRWDYVDRSAANFHGLWTANPDGSNPAILWGNYTMHINACYQPRAIPGSQRILFVAGAHHADVGGSLVIVDPQRSGVNRSNGEDDFASIEVLTPEVCFPESAGWPKSYFHSPWPLSEDFYLVSFSYDPLPGMSSGGKADSTGLYYLDRFGNLELLYRDEGESCMYPIPLAPRTVPPAVKSALDRALGSEGEFMLTDVNQSLLPMPRGRPARELRIFQVLPKTTHVANDPRIGHANAESARMLLGTVPVETDGSARFLAPAGKPLYFQAVDGEGRAIQTMRSVTYLQPGERRGCVGCHEGSGAAPVGRAMTLALKREPSRIDPGPDGSRPFSFMRLVQPILDEQCVRCHDGTAGAGRSRLALTREPVPKGPFTRSYENLKPFVRWYEWGDKSIAQVVTRPGESGADASTLMAILEDPTHAAEVKLSKEQRERLLIWLDANVPFYGVYGKEEQAAQRRGELVSEPAVQ